MPLSGPQITACTMDCPDACSLIITPDRTGHPRIQGNPDHPFTRGFVCAKIKRHIQRLNRPDRVLHPLRKTRGGGWETLTWEQALDLCAAKIQALRGSPAAILHLPGEGAKGVLKKGVQRFFRQLGASRVRGTLCDGAGYVAYVRDFGSRKNHVPDDLLQARRVVNWGKDLSRSSIHTAAVVRKAKKSGARVMSISPGGDGNLPFSDEMIRIRPGTDRFLAAAIIRRLLAKDLVSGRVIAKTRRWEHLRDLILSRSEEACLESCEVSRPQADRLFQWYTGEGPTATLVGTGLQRYRYGGENVRFINALVMCSGNMGITGGGSYYHLHSFANLNLNWIKDPQNRSQRTFLMPMAAREILAARDPAVRMLWINGTNFVNQAPNIRQTIRAFEAVDFKVVVDAFMNDTAQSADLILPAALMLEQEDIVGSYLHEYVQYARAVLPAPGEARDDYGIVADLGRRLDPPVVLPDREEALRSSLESPLLDAPLETLRRTQTIRARRPRVAYDALTFDHPDRRYHPPADLHDEPDPPEGFPYRLLTLIRRDFIHSLSLIHI